ncbi:MAG: hypothetical protein ACYCOU_24765 [Sulfobacillus sp.]
MWRRRRQGFAGRAETHDGDEVRPGHLVKTLERFRANERPNVGDLTWLNGMGIGQGQLSIQVTCVKSFGLLLIVHCFWKTRPPVNGETNYHLRKESFFHEAME